MKNFYSAKLVSHSTGFLIPLGILLILFGITSIILSSIDLINNRFDINDSKTTSANDTEKLDQFLNAFSEQSIWPTIGKGIWCGLYFIAVGIFSLISYREKTLTSIRILSLLAFISIFISLFLFLSSIIVFQRYIIEGRLDADQRTSIEQKEVILNSLLFVCGVLALLTSLALAIGAIIAGNFCQSHLEDDDKYYQQTLPTYSSPPYYR